MDSWQSDKTSSIHCNVSILIRTFRNGRSPTYAKNSAITLVELCLTSLFNLSELFKDGSRTNISRNCNWEYNMRVFTMTGWAPSEVMVYTMCTTTDFRYMILHQSRSNSIILVSRPGELAMLISWKKISFSSTTTRSWVWSLMGSLNNLWRQWENRCLQPSASLDTKGELKLNRDSIKSDGGRFTYLIHNAMQWMESGCNLFREKYF